MKSLLERLDFLNDSMGSAIYEDADTCGEAAAELRRLYALNAELLEALILADAMLSGANMNAGAVEKKVRAAIAKAESEKKKPRGLVNPGVTL